MKRVKGKRQSGRFRRRGGVGSGKEKSNNE